MIIPDKIIYTKKENGKIIEENTKENFFFNTQELLVTIVNNDVLHFPTFDSKDRLINEKIKYQNGLTETQYKYEDDKLVEKREIDYFANPISVYTTFFFYQDQLLIQDGKHKKVIFKKSSNEDEKIIYGVEDVREYDFMSNIYSYDDNSNLTELKEYRELAGEYSGGWYSGLEKWETYKYDKENRLILKGINIYDEYESIKQRIEETREYQNDGTVKVVKIINDDNSSAETQYFKNDILIKEENNYATRYYSYDNSTKTDWWGIITEERKLKKIYSVVNNEIPSEIDATIIEEETVYFYGKHRPMSKVDTLTLPF